MKLYVRSRGSDRSHEYAWITQGGEEDEPPLIETEEFRVVSFYSSGSFAMILLRKNSQLLLFLTGVKAEWSASGGAVYHSFVWLCQDDRSEENLMRRLVVQILREELQGEIGSTIKSVSDNRFGFQVDFSNLEIITSSLESTLNISDEDDEDNTSEVGKLGKNTPSLRKELIEYLCKNRLPKSDGFLVIVSDFASPSLLEEVNVWRGLSSKIKGSTWYEVKKKSPQLDRPGITETTKLSELPKTNSKKAAHKPKSMSVFIRGLIAGILIGMVVAQIHIQMTGKPLFNIPYIQNQIHQKQIQNKD